MKRAKVVIGSVFGDEGKGLMVDYHASQDLDTIVVRFNGGAQAGHTVVTPGGRRHVFSHFGSGALAGAATYLSRHFIVNPIRWAEEHRELGELGCAYRLIYAHPDAVVTTPFDMLINQFLEESRGARNHGSVGLGINETVVRSEIENFRITVRDLKDPNLMAAKLFAIRSEYVPWRLEKLRLEVDRKQTEILNNIYGTEAMFISIANRMADVIWTAGEDIITSHSAIVFEGAQGLLLDQDHPFFPHVTRSSTGLRNVQEIASNVGIDMLEVDYMMRGYMTRHGAGPFPSFDAGLSYVDETNVPHPWQGTMRFGAFDVDLIAEAIRKDLLIPGADVRPRIVMTHIDQSDENGHFPIMLNDISYRGHWSDGLRAIKIATGIMESATSAGPTREHIEIPF